MRMKDTPTRWLAAAAAALALLAAGGCGTPRGAASPEETHQQANALRQKQHHERDHPARSRPDPAAPRR
jgi:hypothetical protein